MADAGFRAALLETEVIVTHVGDGHIYRFPILPNGTVSRHGARIEPNPKAERGYRAADLNDAYDAARAAYQDR
jgi:hypothetical protein